MSMRRLPLAKVPISRLPNRYPHAFALQKRRHIPWAPSAPLARLDYLSRHALAGAAQPASPSYDRTDGNVTTAATTKRPATSDDRCTVMMLGKREGLRATGEKKPSDLPLGICVVRITILLGLRCALFLIGHTAWIAHWMRGFGVTLGKPGNIEATRS